MFYDLLYTYSAYWTKRLTDAMIDHQFLLPFKYGEGYMINDRKWLHGREAPTGGVATNRVHRLVFLGEKRSHNVIEIQPGRPDPILHLKY
jgi:hypothetical protein